MSPLRTLARAAAILGGFLMMSIAVPTPSPVHLEAPTAAAPQGVPTGSGTRIDSGYPPVRYQGDGIASPVAFLNQAGINQVCGEAQPGFVTRACAGVGENWIALPNPCSLDFTGEKFARIACHELGHHNGWPGDHPRP